MIRFVIVLQIYQKLRCYIHFLGKIDLLSVGLYCMSFIKIGVINFMMLMLFLRLGLLLLGMEINMILRKGYFILIFSGPKSPPPNTYNIKS